MKPLISISAAALFSFGFSANGDFKLVKSGEGVTLYERWYSLSGGKQARELKASFTVKNTCAQVVAMIHNQHKGLEWNTGASSFAIRNLTASGWITYICYDLPWPLDDQDCVLKYTRADAGSQTILHFASTSHATFPVKEGISRIPNVKGRWLLQQLSGATRVEYYITTTPSATLPRSLTDPVVRNNLISGLAKLKKLLE